MKVILKKDFRTLGRSGDIKQVKDGYARNYLIPRGIAEVATDGAIKSWKSAEDKRKKKREQENKALSAIAEKISQITLSFTRKVNEDGIMFGSVAKGDIVKSLKAADVEIKREMIDLPSSIKAVGNFEVSVYLNADVSAKIKVTVVAQN